MHGTARRQLKDIRPELDRCAKCGKCRSVCPVFLETIEEGMVARGRITLLEALLAGDVSASRQLRDSLRSCMKCLRCCYACPSGVRMDTVIQSARDALADEVGSSLSARFILRHLLLHRPSFDRAIKGAALLQRVIPGERRGSMRHLPLFFTGKRWVPNLAGRSVLQGMCEAHEVRAPRLRAAFFVGCLINYVFPEVAEALVRVLNHLDISVIIPRGQVCCGTPAQSMGDRVAARKLADRNLQAFAEARADVIVTACASCGRALKSEYPDLLGSESPFEMKVWDISELLAEMNSSAFRPMPINETVAYHDPCHLKWGQGISHQPRELLDLACDYREMEDADRCCGQGGVFSLYHHDLAVRIGESKLEAVREADVRAVATGCPGCMLHLKDELAENRMDVDVWHTVQLVERALIGSAASPGG